MLVPPTGRKKECSFRPSRLPGRAHDESEESQVTTGEIEPVLGTKPDPGGRRVDVRLLSHLLLLVLLLVSVHPIPDVPPALAVSHRIPR